MEEKTMVNDILEETKSNLISYQGAISETENMELRQTMQQIRNNSESLQYELFKIVKAKGYYISSQETTVMEMDIVKTELQDN